MSAITGIFFRDNRKVSPQLIKNMNHLLSHRGPDGSSIWNEGSMGLGHQMLHTTPESLHEKLPNEEDGLVITADARIDNRKELSQKLNIPDNEEIPDSHYILKAYQKWGDKTPEKLLGDFAFAIWDREKDQLFCARDHMGIKPFYYYQSDQVFLFGSEAKALFTLPEVPFKLNELAIAYFLEDTNEDNHFTFFDGLIRLPAAHSLTVNLKGSRLNQYWKLNYKHELQLDSDREYADAFRRIFTSAISCRMRSAFPLGATLSGGLDSSSVLCTAMQNKNQKLKTFSMAFHKFSECDESYYVNFILKKYEPDHTFIAADDIGAFTDLKTILFYQNQPYSHIIMAMVWNWYKNAQKSGVRIMLSGLDGDTVVSHGGELLIELLYTWQFKKLMREVRMISDEHNYSFYKTLWHSAILPSLSPTWIRLGQLLLRRSNYKSKYIVNQDFAHRTNISELHRMKPGYRARKTHNARKFHYYYLQHGDDQHMLEIEDKAAAAFNIEARHPFYDKRLVEFILSIPADQKLRKGYDRYILRKAMQNILPSEIQWRKGKIYFTEHFIKSIAFNDTLQDVILNKSDLIRKYVNPDHLKVIYRRYKEKGDLDDAITLWKIVCLVIWFQETKFN